MKQTRFYLQHSRPGDQYPVHRWFYGDQAERDAHRDARTLAETRRVNLYKWDHDKWVEVKP